MSSVIIAGNTSGTITLDAPNVAGTTVLTLPTANGTILTTANTFGAGTGPAFSVYLSANQSITTATTTKIAFNTELFDTNSNFDTSTYRFTPTVAGYYNVGLTCSYIGSAVIRFIASIFKNGSEFYRVSDSNGDVYLGGSSQVIYMNGTTDYIEFYGSVSGTGVGFEGANTYRSNAFGCLVRSA
jgi:hypothetical protein